MNDLFKKRNELAQKLASMTPDDVLKMRTGYAGKSQQWQYGFDLACREKQIEIDALKAENKRLQEKCEHSAIARFSWRNKYLTLIGSIIAILGLDDLTARDDVVLAVEALKALNAELISSFSEVLRISDRQHDAWDAAKASIAKARGDQV